MAGVVVFEAEAIIFPDQLAFQLSRNGSAVHRFSGPRLFRSALRRPEQQLREVGAEYIRKNSAPGFPMDGLNFLCPMICAVRVHHSRYTPPISHPILKCKMGARRIYSVCNI